MIEETFVGNNVVKICYIHSWELTMPIMDIDAIKWFNKIQGENNIWRAGDYLGFPIWIQLSIQEEDSKYYEEIFIIGEKIIWRWKPARIPPQTPPAGGEISRGRANRNPRQIASPCRVHFISFNHLDFD